MPQVTSIQENDQLMPAAWRVLSVFLRRSVLTQAELRKHTGLSHPVIVQQVRLLRHAGLINPGKPILGQPGRPCIPLDFNWDFRRLLAVDVHPSGVTLQGMNLHCEERGAPRVAPLPSWSHTGIRRALIREIGHALQEPGSPWAGIGIVLPAVISTDGDGVSCFPGLPEWQSDALGAELSERFAMPVTLENEANVLAYSLEPTRLVNTETLLTVTFRHPHFLRVGICLEGYFMQGMTNGAGSIGQVAVERNDDGGSLETLLIASRDDPSRRPRFVRALAESLIGLVSALSPARLIIQGDAMWQAEEMDLLRGILQKSCPPAVMETLSMEDRPARATEALLGVANKLCRRVLDLREGTLTAWARQVSSN